MEITGRLTADATVKHVAELNRDVTNFTIALNNSYRTKTGEYVDRVLYVECDYWLGTGVAPYLKKGVVVRAYGNPEITAYTNRQGYPTPKFLLHVRDIELITSAKKAVNPEGDIIDVEPTVVQQTVPAAAGENEDPNDLPF